jgi:glycosyltransferase involved in cell wall biosynthesis
VKIALVTEGTYPHGFGGVSVWCDQLVRGLARHNFDIVALIGTGNERTRWELPANVDTVRAIPLWGREPNGSRPSPENLSWFTGLFTRLIRSLLADSNSVPAQADFDEAMRGLFLYGQLEDLGTAMRAEIPVRLLQDAWAGAPIANRAGAPTIDDAITTIELLEHWMRPLSAPPVRADVVHTVANGLASIVALAAKWSFGTPFLLTEHGVYLRERYLGTRAAQYRWPVKVLVMSFYRRLCAMAYRNADLIAPGNQYNQRWEERLGADPRIIRTVYNGVDPAAFPAAEEEPDVPTISWAGRIDPIKDLETAIRAFALLRQRLPTARFRVFGGPASGREWYLKQCEDLAAQLGVADSVVFEGRVDNIRDAYAAGHVVVMSSISEGFPYTLIEAMTCGRATVSTDVGGCCEAVADTGLIVPPRDAAAMASACHRLLDDHQLRREMGAAARNRALELFTVDKAIGIFNSLYAELARPASRVPVH